MKTPSAGGVIGTDSGEVSANRPAGTVAADPTPPAELPTPEPVSSTLPNMPSVTVSVPLTGMGAALAGVAHTRSARAAKRADGVRMVRISGARARGFGARHPARP